MNARVYNTKIDINNEDTKSFWNARGTEPAGLKSVLLAVDKDDSTRIRRNNKENHVLNSVVSKLSSLKVLDIGCGIGRWAENLKDRVEYYTGFDYSHGFIKYAQNKYREYKNINFIEMSLLDLDIQKLTFDYNLVLCTGVLEYINDIYIPKILKTFRGISPEYVYIQESISLMDGRLTLSNFQSKELKTNYSAIYRTKKEYEEFFKQSGFDIIETGLLLDDTTGAREETNAQYWVLRG